MARPRPVYDGGSPPSGAAALRLATLASAPPPPKGGWAEGRRAIYRKSFTPAPQGFTVFALPLAHQLRLRTSNALERVNQEIKRRTRVARLFPNEASLLRLVTALLNEFSDEWQTTRVYLNMENHPQPSV